MLLEHEAAQRQTNFSLLLLLLCLSGVCASSVPEVYGFGVHVVTAMCTNNEMYSDSVWEPNMLWYSDRCRYSKLLVLEIKCMWKNLYLPYLQLSSVSRFTCYNICFPSYTIASFFMYIFCCLQFSFFFFFFSFHFYFCWHWNWGKHFKSKMAKLKCISNRGNKS